MSGRNKIDHMRAKEETVKFGDKEYTIKPKRNKELFELAEEIKDEWGNISDRDLNWDNLIKVVQKKPVELIDKMVEEEFTKEDFMNGYPNDIYNVVVIFKEVNFTFVQKLSGIVQRIAQFITANKDQLTNQQ